MTGKQKELFQRIVKEHREKEVSDTQILDWFIISFDRADELDADREKNKDSPLPSANSFCGPIYRLASCFTEGDK